MNATAEKVIDVQITMKVSEDTLVSAFASGNISGPFGYAYWCDGVRLAGSRNDGDAERVAKSLLNGADVKVIEIEVERTGKRIAHTLTREAFLRGFGRWAIESNRAGNTDEATGVTDFDIDAPASDMILQYAVFNEQKYG